MIFFIAGLISGVLITNKNIKNTDNQHSVSNPATLEDENILPEQMIALTFDDGKIEDYTVTSKLLNKRGLKATFYIVPDFVGKDGYMTWEQIKELHDDGHDIQCHSYYHSDLTTLTEEELRADFEAVGRAFLENNLPLPKHHAYPYGSYNKEVMIITAGYRLTGRGVENKTARYFSEHPSIYDWNSLIICNWGGAYNLDLEPVFNKIDEVLKSKQVTTLIGHGVSETPGAWDTSIEDFGAILDYLEENNFEVVTMSQLYDALFKVYKNNIYQD